MTDYLSPGTIQELMVTSISEEGVFVGNDHEEIPLNKIDTKGVVLGQTLKIFSYFNDRKELEATIKLPEIQVGEMGMFSILNSNELSRGVILKSGYVTVPPLEVPPFTRRIWTFGLDPVGVWAVPLKLTPVYQFVGVRTCIVFSFDIYKNIVCIMFMKKITYTYL